MTNVDNASTKRIVIKPTKMKILVPTMRAILIMTHISVSHEFDLRIYQQKHGDKINKDDKIVLNNSWHMETFG